MKKILLLTAFTLTTVAWMSAQQAGGAMGQSGQAPGSQLPGTTQQQPGVPSNPDPSATPPGGAQGQASNAPITEGCLGGTAPNFTITDKAGTTYKLNIPASANTAALTPHVGESVKVQGDVNSGKASSIDVQRIGPGTGTCAGSATSGAQPSPKQ